MFQSAIAFLETQGVPTPFATAIIRLLLGSICGGLIGLEREMKGRPAGLKTFSLVCMGATLVMVTNEFIYVNVANSTGDSARMAAQVISGIGFLGAGTIMTTGNDRVKGLTTAAALWVTAAIGIAIGTGFYFGGIAGLIVLYLSSFTYRYIDAVIVARSRIMRIYVEGESEEFMYAARRRQKSVERKFQLGKLCIGHQFQLFDNSLRQFPQGSFIGHQVALHEPQLLHQPQP